MKKLIFKGAGVAIVTPFKPDGSINFDVFSKLIEFQIANETDAIIVCGTTGESATMTNDEQARCIEFVVKKVNGRVPVIGGAGTNNTAHALELVKTAAGLGVNGILSVTPYYNKTTQEGLYRHFTAIADAAGDVPVIVYNVPARTGLNIMPETYARLAKHPNINSIKEANGNLPATIKTLDLCGDEVYIYSGEDTVIIPMLSIGCMGVISVLSNICPKETHDMCSLWFAGKVEESAKLQIKYSDLVAALFCEVSPIPVKTALKLMGYEVGDCRLPLCEIGESAKKQLVASMQKFGLIG
ncbi:MAG TPA: 4-hydroxy-tetrahydrodipicolinate synthase [Oscillospiraceae bacterium]|nr:4-hydroxy-tetrahydrodipicolinate synthase [Oscillospiraceae bacterium]HPS34916.1 4-hydroxy-tetrahydrodipicolinate synthase [Oscillospiraceae bacterium]